MSPTGRFPEVSKTHKIMKIKNIAINTTKTGWDMVTDIACIVPGCPGSLRWAEAGYVPGYRICDCCGSHYALANPGSQRDGLTIVRRFKVSTAKVTRMRADRAEASARSKEFDRDWAKKNTAKANAAWLDTDSPSSHGGVHIPATDPRSGSGCTIEDIRPAEFAALIRQCWEMQAQLNQIDSCNNRIQIIHATRDSQHVLVYHCKAQYGQWDGWWKIDALRIAIKRGFPRTDEKMTAEQRKLANIWR